MWNFGINLWKREKFKIIWTIKDMSNYIKTRGITISSNDYGDTSKILSVFTKEYGSLDVLARGCKKKGSPLLPLCSNFCVCDFVLVNSKGKYIVSSIDVVKNFYDLSKDIEKFAVASFLAYVCKTVASPMESHNALFALLINMLFTMETTNVSVLNVLVWFSVKCQDIFGIRPNIYSCVNCGENKNIVGFSIIEGGLICENCSHEFQFKAVNMDYIHIMDFVLKHKNSDIPLMSECDKDLTRLCLLYIKENIGLCGKCFEYMKKLKII